MTTGESLPGSEKVRRLQSVLHAKATHDHAEYAAQLEWEHRDPWDRLLAAQALLENCALVSIDRVFDGTAVDRRW